MVSVITNAFRNLVGDKPRFLFSDPQLKVLSFSGSEGISELYQYQLELVSSSPDLPFSKYVGQPFTLSIEGANNHRRYVGGIIARFEAVGFKPEGTTTYRATLVPSLAKLLYQRRLRIFQDLTTQQIVSKVLDEGGVKPHAWKLRESYQPRNYCVQYRESDFEFISRLLEEEGIAFHFDHLEKEVTTIFSDHQEAFLPIVGLPQVAFNPRISMVGTEENVHRLCFGKQLRTGKVELRDYDFRKPRLELKAVETGSEQAKLELYEYPGEFVDPGLGERLARIRLEEYDWQRQDGQAESNCSRFSAGRRFTLGGALPGQRHPRADLNQEYLILRLSQDGAQEQVLGEEGALGGTTYRNSLQVIPARAPYRPPRLTKRPMAIGAHTATVVGPKGEEIYVDEHGRVKVWFHFDREAKKDQTSSCWIRVSHDWAGTGYGGICIPRIGQEVLVTFLEGDPDRPVISGRMYNGMQKLPYELPANKTRGTLKSNSSLGGGGSNEIRFEDKKGKEELFIHAQLDYNIEVLRDRTTKATRDRKENILRNQEVHVKNQSTLTADEFLFEGDKSLTLRVGGSTIKLTPFKVDSATTTLDQLAGAINTIEGALVMIDGGPVTPAVPGPSAIKAQPKLSSEDGSGPKSG